MRAEDLTSTLNGPDFFSDKIEIGGLASGGLPKGANQCLHFGEEELVPISHKRREAKK